MNIKKTIALLEEADAAYHSGAESALSDREYDELKDRARKEFSDHPYFKTVGAPVKGVAWKVRRHRIPMGSIQNLDLQDPLGDFARWWSKVGRPELLAQMKLDGLSLSLEYEGGPIVAATLRGDGMGGEDVLRNVLRISGLPMELSKGVGMTVRGEILLSRRELADINKLQEAAGERPYANCRNAAAGIVRRLDGRYSDRLSFVAFEFDAPNDPNIGFFHLEQLFGFRIVEGIRTNDPAKVAEFYNKVLDDDRSGRAEFCCDGVVAKAVSYKARADIGGDALLPDWIRALKFPPEEGAFRVDDIRWFIGKTGKLTPVLHSHAGTQFKDKIVHEVTLHNYAYFCRLRLAPGDKVSVVISGDVIPKAGEVVERSGGALFEAPKVCPECRSLLRVGAGDGPAAAAQAVFLWCDAAGCDGRAKAVVLAHAREMGIDEVGPGLVDRLFAAGKAGKIRFSDAADLYALTERDLLKVEGFAGRSAEKVVANVRSRMEVDLPTFVASLGIPGVGVRMIEKFGSKDLDGLMKMTPEDFKKADGVGDRMATAISDGLAKNYHLIGRLLANGVRIKAKRKAAVKGNVLGGRSFCFTGDIREQNPDTGKPWTRDEVWALVEANGGVVKSGVSKKLDVLVLADPGSASSKARKAREYGVETMSAAEFLRKVEA